MKTLFVLVVSWLLAAAPTIGAAVSVTASQKIRIALVDGGGAAAWSPEFAPNFGRAVNRLYGADAPLEMVVVTADAAARGLREAQFDAVIVFAERVPSVVRRTGAHAIRAVAREERASGAFLVLRQEQPELDALLANAFNIAFHREGTRPSLPTGRPLVATR